MENDVVHFTSSVENKFAIAVEGDDELHHMARNVYGL